MHVDGKIPEWSAGALRLLRAPTTTLAGSDIDIGAVASIPTAVVELLANGV